MRDIGKAIKIIRDEKNLTQRELAKISGVTYSSLTKIETGFIKNPTIDIMIRLSKALEVTIDEIVKRGKLPK